MQQKQQFKTICYVLIAMAVVFLTIFLPIYFTQIEKPSSQTRSDIVIENLPTDSWTDYTAQPASGTGTTDDPYLISSAEEFAWLYGNSATSIVLTQDIDLSAHLWKPFTKTIHIDGGGHAIIGMKVYETASNKAGLFATTSSVQLRNFILKNALVYIDMDSFSSSSSCYASFLVAYDSASYNYFETINVSIQDSQMYVKNFSSKVYVGQVCGYFYKNGGTIDEFSSINTTINVSSEKTTYDFAYVAGVCAYYGQYSSYNIIQNNCIIDNFKVNVDFLASRNKYFYTTGLTNYISSVEEYYFASNCYIDIELSMSSRTPERYTRQLKQYEGYVNSLVRKEDGLTTVPENYDLTLWKNADENNSFTSIYLNNRFFIEYYNLSNEFNNDIQFWKDFAEEPQGSNDVYKVSTAEQLAYAIEHGGKYYLQNDIDLAGKYWTPTTNYLLLYGQGYAIKNVNINIDYYKCKNKSRPADVGFAYNLNTAYNLTFENTTITGKNITHEVNIMCVGGNDYSINSYSSISSVLLIGLKIDIQSSKRVNIYGLTYRADNGNTTYNFANNAIVDADIKVKSTSYTSVCSFFGEVRYSGVLNKMAFTGNVDLDAPSAYVKLCGVTMASPSSRAYRFTNCVVSGNINLHNGETPIGTVEKFGSSYTISCMEANLNITAEKIISNNDEEYKDLTTIPETFPLSTWSQVNAGNERWPYIFPNIAKFMKYYNLTFISTTIDTWANYISVPAGSGTETNPWIITSAQELAYLQAECMYQRTYYVNLEADIDLAAHIWKPIGISGKNPSFRFYGNGHTISNLNISYSENDYVGLFGCISSSTTSIMENLTIKNAKVSGYTAGTLVGSGSVNANKIIIINTNIKATNVAQGIGASTAQYCYVSGTIVGATNAIGVSSNSSYSENHATIIGKYGSARGIGGSNNKYCKNYGDITAYTDASGIGGHASYCENYGNVRNINPSPTGNAYIGGITGYWGNQVSYCINYGDVTCESDSSYCKVGGIVAESRYEVIGCVNFGNVTGGYFTGGIIGYSSNTSATKGIASKCNNYGNVTCNVNVAAGIVAYCRGGILDSCINSGIINAKSYAGGIVASDDQYGMTVKNCSNTAEIHGGSVGGIVSYAGYSSVVISNCCNSGDVYASSSTAGGIVGSCNSVNMTECIVLASVTSTSNGNAYVGGLIGSLASVGSGTLISSSYFSGTLSSSGCDVGGIVGEVASHSGLNEYMQIEKCYIQAKVNVGTYSSNSKGIAGVIGEVYNTARANISNVYVKFDIIGENTRIDKLVGYGPNKFTVNNTYYDITIKASEEDEGTAYKEYVLGTDVTEENAFSNEIWYFGSQIGVLRPMPRAVFHQGDRLESQNILDWIKANGYTLAA